MNKEDFEKQMYAEWRRCVLDNYIDYCETKEFDQLKDLQDCDKLYSFFYPIVGFKSDKLETVAELAWRVLKTELSIVVAEISYHNDFVDKLSNSNIEQNLIPLYEKLSKKQKVNKEIFVTCGWYSDITAVDVDKIILQQQRYIGRYKDSIKQFAAYDFDSDTLDLIHSFVPRFVGLDNLNKHHYSEEDSNKITNTEDGLTLKFKNLSESLHYEEETTNLIEEALKKHER